MGTISAEKKSSGTYYVYRESYRVKINPKDTGKGKGSGKSKVRTRSVYLGTAETILKSVEQNKEPLKVNTRRFGLVGAAYQTAVEMGLQEVLEKHIPGKRGGIPQWIYFLVSIINRVDNATSKNKMSQWLARTILPELLSVDPSKFTGKNFWYAADSIISEKEYREATDELGSQDGPMMALQEDRYTDIEKDLFRRIDSLMGLSPSAICYDTTNFYTYIEEPTRSELANTCRSKASKHHLRHVGLLMAVEKNHGVPLVSQIYSANRHDSRVFSSILADLVVVLKDLCGSDSDLIVVLDKGNNSEDNFTAMNGAISWVGSLVPSHHGELIDLDLSAYHGTWKDYRYYRCTKTVMGVDCSLVLTYNPATKRKQQHSLKRGIERLKRDMRAKWAGYKTEHSTLTSGLLSMKQKSRYGSCFECSVEQGRLDFQENTDEIHKREKRFGKSVIFSNMLEAEAGFLIDTYHEKNIIEDDFRILKDNAIIRFHPIRHWTDTKIRAYALCCVAALSLMRVMQWKAENAGYKMSPQLLKDELSDIREVIMVYSRKRATRMISNRSMVQNKLWKEFKLDEIEQIL
ncbi:IS1634 family transposase [Thermodesulfobacteriota bacterium]